MGTADEKAGCVIETVQNRVGMDDGMSPCPLARLPFSREMAAEPAPKQVLATKGAARKIGMFFVNYFSTSRTKESPHAKSLPDKFHPH